MPNHTCSRYLRNRHRDTLSRHYIIMNGISTLVVMLRRSLQARMVDQVQLLFNGTQRGRQRSKQASKPHAASSLGAKYCQHASCSSDFIILLMRGTMVLFMAELNECKLLSVCSQALVQRCLPYLCSTAPTQRKLCVTQNQTSITGS